MKTSDILNLDCRKKENKEIIKKVLCKIKPLSKYSDEESIPQEAVEKLIATLNKKYYISIQYINMHQTEGGEYYFAASIKTENTHEWLGNVCGITMYELLAKLAIKMFSEVRSRDIPIRVETEISKERKARIKDKDKDD